MGWVARRRDLGNLLFLDVRDRAGIVQVVFNKETQPAAHAKPSKRAANSWSLWKARSSSARKPIRIGHRRSRACCGEAAYSQQRQDAALPIDDEISAAEETRLRFRYLDLRGQSRTKTSRCATRSSSKFARHGRDGLPRSGNAHAHALERRKARAIISCPAACITASFTRCRNPRNL